MDQYTVTGMSCAACQARVEKAVNKVPGVESCNVSLLTNTMGVEGTASPADIMKAVEDAGYGASPKGAGQESGRQAGSLTAKIAAEEEALKDHETPVLKKRLIASLGFLLVLMYFSMGHMMFGWPLPAFFDDNHVAMGIVQMLLAGIVMVINQKFFISGFKSLFHGAPNMDTLIAMGSGAAFVYSTVMLLAMTRAQVDGNQRVVVVVEPHRSREGVGLAGDAALVLIFKDSSDGIPPGVLPSVHLWLGETGVVIGETQHGAVAEVPNQAVAGALVPSLEGNGVVQAPYRILLQRIGGNVVHRKPFSTRL